MGAHGKSEGWRRGRQGLLWCHCEQSLGGGVGDTICAQRWEQALGPEGSVGSGEDITLGEEVGLVLPAPHSKDPADLIREGWVEEHSLPGALGAKSGAGGRAPAPISLC